MSNRYSADFIQQGSAGLNVPIIQVLSTSGNIAGFNYIVKIDASSGSVVATLPSCLGKTGQKVEVCRIDNTTNPVYVVPFSGQSINGITNAKIYLYNQGDGISFFSDGTNAYANLDNRSSVGSSNSYMRVYRATAQTTLSGAVVFTNIDTTVGEKITLNTTTGIITLKSDSTYSLSGYMGSLSHNGFTNRGSCIWQKSTDNGTTWTNTGQYGSQVAPSSAWNSTSSSQIATASISTTSNTLMRLVISDTYNVSALGSSSANDYAVVLPWAEVREEVRQVPVINTVDTFYSVKTGGQALSAAGDLTFVKQSGNLAFDGTYVTLLADKTYELSAGVSGSESTPLGFAELSFTNDSNIVLENSRFISRGVQYSGATNGTEMPNCEILYTPSVNTKVKVRAMIINEGTHSFWNGTYFKVVQVGSSAVSSVSSTLIDAPWTDYTPAFTATITNPVLGTGAIVNAKYCTIGKSLKLNVNLYNPNAGTLGNGNYIISIPSGFTLDTTKIRTTTLGYDGSGLGSCLISIGSNYGANGKVVAVSSTQLGLYCATPWNANSPLMFWSSAFHGMGANTCVSFTCEIPIL